MKTDITYKILHSLVTLLPDKGVGASQSAGEQCAWKYVCTITLMCLCVFLHPAWSVWWHHLPALCTGELPSAPPVGKGAFGFMSSLWPYSFSQPLQPQSYGQLMSLSRRGRRQSIQASAKFTSLPDVFILHVRSSSVYLFQSALTNHVSVVELDRKHRRFDEMAGKNENI